MRVLHYEGVLSKTDAAAITEALSWDMKYLDSLVNARQTSKLSTWTFFKTDEAAITEALSWDRKYLEMLVNARQTSKLSTWTKQKVQLKKDIARMRL